MMKLRLINDVTSTGVEVVAGIFYANLIDKGSGLNEEKSNKIDSWADKVEKERE